MKTFTDQMGREVQLEATPKRIISIVPSQTQLLHYLGMEDEVIGITKFCIHPDEWYQTKNRVGGTKQLDIHKIRDLRPDLIIGNKEENTIEDIALLETIAPVWMSDIYTLQDAKEMILEVGIMVENVEKAQQLMDRIESQFSILSTQISQLNTFAKSVMYLIWHDPDMVVGTNTFIDEMLQQCGLKNCIKDPRYPNAPTNLQPDYLFLSSEPYPFRQKHVDHFINIYPDSQIIFVDGEMFSWYGSKLVEAPAYFLSLLKQISLK